MAVCTIACLALWLQFGCSQVPESWSGVAYMSMRPLTSWYQNLLERNQQLLDFAVELMAPKVCFCPLTPGTYRTITLDHNIVPADVVEHMAAPAVVVVVVVVAAGGFTRAHVTQGAGCRKCSADTSCSRPGMLWKGGGVPPPLQGAQPMPSHCLPDAKCQLQRHL